MLFYKKIISQHVAKQIAQISETTASKLGLHISIAIVNEAGILIYFSKMDKSTEASVDISVAKAKHAAYYQRDTKFHEDLLKDGNSLVLSLPNSMPIEGGVQLVYQGSIIGAIGISGASSIQDGIIAKAGADFFVDFKEE
jgi:glc operon protein GlcG